VRGRLIYPNQQIVLLAGCSPAEPASPSDLQNETIKKALKKQKI
jgi:hypothetical protein